MNEAAAYAARALAQDAQCYAGIFLRGLVASKRGDIESALRDLRLACEQKPGDTLIVNELMRHFFSAGQEHSESAGPVYEEALRVDPLHPLNWAQTSWRHFSAGRLAEAAESARRIFHLTEQGNPTRVYGAYYLALANQHEEAIAAFEAEGKALSGTAYGAVSLFLSRALQQDAAGAVRHVTPQLEQAASWTEFLALFLADGYALIGHQDDALRWLRKAVGLGFINYPYLATHDPFLANVRSDRRCLELLREVKARWEALSQNLPKPLPAPSRVNLSPASEASVSPTLRHTVGREPERNELRAALTAANNGRGSLLCVAGEPGIGKTTLVEDFLTELTTKYQCTIARGRCSERLAGTEAYLPLLEALQSLLQGDKSLAGTMKQLAPTWYAQVVPFTGESEEAARLLAEVKAASQERMKRELASFLTAVAEPQPLVIFFDDLHWADVSTVDLLSFLAGKFDAMRVLIVTTYRPSDMLLAKHPFLQIKPDLQARGLCRELQLEFLNKAEIAQYLKLEFPSNRFPTGFPQLIHAKTEGSPLFMADLVRYLRDRGVIAQSSGAWMLAQTLPDIERELPESVRGMIERKIAQLSEEDRKLLTAASVQGYEFDSAVVAQVLKLDADEVEERLENLERVFAFVKLTSEAEFPNRTLTLKYRFVHVHYQNALYASLRATRKATLSREVAQTMEGFYGEQRTGVANQLAALYEAGREYARAAEYYRLAAEQATRVAAYQEAVVLARRGLGLLKSEPDTTAHARQELALRITLSVLLGACRGLASQENRELFTRARELAQQLGNPPELLTIMYGQWRSYLIGGG